MCVNASKSDIGARSIATTEASGDVSFATVAIFEASRRQSDSFGLVRCSCIFSRYHCVIPLVLSDGFCFVFPRVLRKIVNTNIAFLVASVLGARAGAPAIAVGFEAEAVRRSAEEEWAMTAIDEFLCDPDEWFPVSWAK